MSIKCLLTDVIRGGYMARYYTQQWGDYIFGINASSGDIRRIVPIIPYFWDNEVAFNLGVKPQKGKRVSAEFLNYEWELCDLDSTVLKKGQGVIETTPKRVHKYWVWSKERAIVLGTLSPNRHYKVMLSLYKPDGSKSDRLLVTAFTTKDRDELYMQILILLIGIVMSVCIGFMARCI